MGGCHSTKPQTSPRQGASTSEVSATRRLSAYPVPPHSAQHTADLLPAPHRSPSLCFRGQERCISGAACAPESRVGAEPRTPHCTRLNGFPLESRLQTRLSIFIFSLMPGTSLLLTLPQCGVRRARWASAAGGGAQQAVGGWGRLAAHLVT